MIPKFRLIQSNNRGLLTKKGDQTYASRGPAKGEEELILPTLFIFVRNKDRFLARCWTKWTGEHLGDDFIYVVTKFRDVLDLNGDTRYHQWCSNQLRQKLWSLRKRPIELDGTTCPRPEDVYEADRYKGFEYQQRRKQRLLHQTPILTPQETLQIQRIYLERDKLNNKAGFIKYHIDHVIPLAKGGIHHPKNLQLLTASENVRKGSKV